MKDYTQLQVLGFTGGGIAPGFRPEIANSKSGVAKLADVGCLDATEQTPTGGCHKGKLVPGVFNTMTGRW